MNINIFKLLEYASIFISLLLILFFSKTNNILNMNSKFESPGINIKFMDTSISPKDDFYKFVNGNWLDSAFIPSDQSVWGGFYELSKNTDNDVINIIEAAMNNKNILRSSDEGKAISLYESFIDIDYRNSIGTKPLDVFLSQINEINDFSSLQDYMEKNSIYNIGSDLFGIYIGPDKMNSNINTAYLYGGSLGLPDRDYYFNKNFSDVRAKYVSHIKKMFKFFNYSDDNAEAIAKSIFDFELQIAKEKMDKVERRDPTKTYNSKSISNLMSILPQFNWNQYLLNIKINADTLIISDLNYFNNLSKVLKNSSIEVIKNYLTWNLINSSADMLTEEIEKANWNFYNKILRGEKKQKPRNERAVSSINWSIGEALGKLYVTEKFPPAAKKSAEEMIDNIISAFKSRIIELSWMNKHTKDKAIEKLEKINVKVGYPDEWKDFSKLKIEPISNGGTFFENKLNLSKWSRQRNIDKLNKKVNKKEWYMSPQIVNAYYSPLNNEIVFPAAILQPPFYDYKADPAVNYGGIGAVIGHEISHAFDDSGSEFDGDGNLKKWWSDIDYKKFNELGDSLASFFSKIEVLPNIFINGKFTLGENIGDLGGVNSAYDALQILLSQNNKIDIIDGFTQNQRFFISWATIWRIKMRDEALKTRIMTDPHSPGMYRGYVPLLHTDSFYEAFDIKEGDQMYLKPQERVKIW